MNLASTLSKFPDSNVIALYEINHPSQKIHALRMVRKWSKIIYELVGIKLTYVIIHIDKYASAMGKAKNRVIFYGHGMGWTELKKLQQD